MRVGAATIFSHGPWNISAHLKRRIEIAGDGLNFADFEISSQSDGTCSLKDAVAASWLCVGN
jgi:hypothetical protein